MLAPVVRSLLDRTIEALFGEARPREDLDEGDPVRATDASVRAVLTRADERVAVTVAVLLLERVRERGGTRVDAEAVARVADRLLSQFSEMEQARVKREVARTLLWLWEAMGADEETADGAAEAGAGLSDEEDEEQTLLIPDRIYPVGDKLDVIRKAISEKQDLEIDYFTFYRGKLAWRRISPVQLEGEDYVIAYCHWRKDERRFRISRIRALRAVPPAPVIGGKN